MDFTSMQSRIGGSGFKGSARTSRMGASKNGGLPDLRKAFTNFVSRGSLNRVSNLWIYLIVARWNTPFH